MKILQFTVPMSDNKTIVVKEEVKSHFYPHLHRHNEVQLSWIRKGEGILVTDTNMHAFTSNEIYWIGANQPHVFKCAPLYFENNPATRSHSLDIFFSIDKLLSSFFSVPEARQVKDFVQQHNMGFKIPEENVENISARMLKLKHSSGLEQFILFIELLMQLSGLEKLKVLSTQSRNESYSDNEGIRLATIYNYVMQHYHLNITLEEVSSLIYMSPHAFCRYFKKHTHHTLISFINEIRVNEACKKLVDKNYDSISCVAYSSGFNSITHFNRVFKSIVNKSPKEYLDSYFYNIDSADFIPSSKNELEEVL